MLLASPKYRAHRLGQSLEELVHLPCSEALDKSAHHGGYCRLGVDFHGQRCATIVQAREPIARAPGFRWRPVDMLA